ncbi:MAG: murein biosynthesis integral membrane protein MurJ [Thermoleophilia bacterium]
MAAAAAFLMAATAVSRVLGLIREQVMLAFLGLGPGMGAFTVAFKIPSLIRTLVADTALSAAFIPVFSELIATGRRREAWQVASTVLLAATLGLGLISIAGVVFAEQVVALAAPGFDDPAAIELAVELTRIMFPTVVLFGLAGILMGILNSHDHFILPALAPILWNLVIIGAAAVFSREYGFQALAWGVLLGTLVQLLIQIPAVAKRGRRELFSLALRHPAVRRVGVLMAPVVLTLGIVNFNVLVNTIIASYISVEAPAVIDKAFRLFQLPQGMFAIAIGTVLFPTLSRLAATQELAGFRRTLSLGVRQIFFVTLPFTAFFLVLGTPTVRLVFEYGRFTAADTEKVAYALAFYSLGMAFVSANTLLNRAFYGLQKTWLPLQVGIVNLVLNAALSLALYRPLGVGGITLSTSLVSAWNFFALFYLLRRQAGSVEFAAVMRSVLKSVAALFPLSAAAYGAWYLADFGLGASVGGRLVSVAAGYAAGLAAYALAARLLGMAELDEVREVVRRRRRRQAAHDLSVEGKEREGL